MEGFGLLSSNKGYIGCTYIACFDELCMDLYLFGQLCIVNLFIRDVYFQLYFMYINFVWHIYNVLVLYVSIFCFRFC